MLTSRQTDSSISVPLTRHHQDLMRLRYLWKTAYVSDHRYEFHVHHSSVLASEILGEALPPPLLWLLPAVAPVTLEEDSESECESEGDITGDLLAETLEDDRNREPLSAIDMSWRVLVCHLNIND